MQCILNHADNRDDDGGTLIVPGFHRIWSQFCDEFGQAVGKQINLPWLAPPSAIEERFMKYAQRIPLRQVPLFIFNVLFFSLLYFSL